MPIITWLVFQTQDVVQLHDASKWSVHSKYRQTVLRWAQSDEIFIKPRAYCFAYDYVLYNRTTRQFAPVNLMEPPLPMGGYTFRVVNIEPNARLIQLSDNTIWRVDLNDPQFDYLKIGDRVLIGVNNNWRTASCPNILIHADRYGKPYSLADFYGYPVGY